MISNSGRTLQRQAAATYSPTEPERVGPARSYRWKRPLDLAAGLVLLVALLPVIGLLALVVRLERATRTFGDTKNFAEQYPVVIRIRITKVRGM